LSYRQIGAEEQCKSICATATDSEEQVATTHRIASVLDLLTLSDEASENVSALLFRLEGDALALL
jgi:hypothetical protein